MPFLILILSLFTSFALAAAPECGPLFDEVKKQETQKEAEIKISDKYDLGAEISDLLQGIVNTHVAVHSIDAKLIQKTFQDLPEVMDPIKILFLESDIAFLRRISAEKASTLLLEIVEKKDYSKLITLVKKLEQRRQEFFANLTFIEGSKSQRHQVYLIAGKYSSTDKTIMLNGKKVSFETASKYVYKNWPKTKEQDIEQVRIVLANYMVSSLRAGLNQADALTVAVRKIKKDLQEDTSVRGDPRIFVYFAKAAFQTLDPHSEFVSPKELSEYNLATARRTPLGIHPVDSAGGLLLIKVLEGSLAEQSGLRAGDTIISINSAETTRFMHRGLTKFLRAQENPILKLEIERGGERQKILLDRNLNVFKEQVPVRFSIEKTSDGKTIATIGFNSFYYGVSKDIKSVLERAVQQNVSGLVLDLRHNGGGTMYDAGQILKLLINTKESLWYSKTNMGIEASEQAQLGGPRGQAAYTQIFNGPIIVLVDNFSASASELSASVLKSFGRAIIVGSRATYGKGSSQDRMRIQTGGLKITSGLFYNRLGESPQYHGVESDIVIARAEVPTISKLERDYKNVIIPKDISKMTTEPTPIITEIEVLRQKSLARQEKSREDVEDPVLHEARQILEDWLNNKP